MARQYKAGLRQTADGSVIDGDGELLFISCRRFVRDIAEGDCCFMCGAKPGSHPFNGEHVIPDWVLRDRRLHNKQINHGNFRSTTYSRFRVPCCVECNSALGKRAETPISVVFKAGPQAVRDLLAKEGPWPIFAWLNLVYLKFLLFDRSVRIHADPRKGGETIGQAFNWSSVHHLQCVARTYLTELEIDHRIMGSTSEVKLSKALLESGLPLNETPFDLGEVSFHMGWTFHRAGPNKSNRPREVMTIIYVDADAKVAEPANKNQGND